MYIFGGAPGGKKPSVTKVSTDFISFLVHDCDQRSNACYTPFELQEAFNRSGLTNPKNSFADFVDVLNYQGNLLMTNVQGQRMWRVQSSSVSMHGSQRC